MAAHRNYILASRCPPAGPRGQNRTVLSTSNLPLTCDPHISFYNNPHPPLVVPHRIAVRLSPRDFLFGLLSLRPSPSWTPRKQEADGCSWFLWPVSCFSVWLFVGEREKEKSHALFVSLPHRVAESDCHLPRLSVLAAERSVPRRKTNKPLSRNRQSSEVLLSSLIAIISPYHRPSISAGERDFVKEWTR
jgi:hypothetical protein